jgi:SAM-dependent methyltransferase
MAHEAAGLSLALAQHAESGGRRASGGGGPEYVLATGQAAVQRLWVLHQVYSPAGRRILLQAGARPGMRIADFGCGVGMTTRMLADIAGPSGEIVGIDLHKAQLDQAARICASAGLSNVSFVNADATKTGLPSGAFDLAYCRFLLLHLKEPAAGLREMCRILKPGGILVVEDGDTDSVESIPATAVNAGAKLFTRLGRNRGLNFQLSRNLFHMVKAAGIPDPDIEIHQPALVRGDSRSLPLWSIEEAASAAVSEGLVTKEQLDRLLGEIKKAVDDPEVIILAPRMTIVWGRKRAKSRGSRETVTTS